MSNSGNRQPMGRFQSLQDPLFAWQRGLWAEMALFGGGGIWPLSRLNGTHNQILDQSGNANTLTISGGGSTFVGENFVIPAWSFPGGAVFAAAGAASALNFGANFSLMTWSRHNVASGISQYWFSKTSAGAPQLQYSFGLGVNGKVILAVYGDGTTLSSFSVDPVVEAEIDVTKWNFYACRFYGGSEARIWINDKRFDFSVGVPASAFSSTSVFRLGWQVNGRMVLPAAVTTTINLDMALQVYYSSKGMFGK